MSLNLFKKLSNPLINYFGKKKIKGRFSKEPIIIGGCGRSGTTLLLSILSAHSNIFAFPREIGAFSEWHGNIPRLDRFYRYILFHKIPSKPDRWCEKTPGNVRHFDKILSYFNNKVKLIHLIRDGRDVMLSRHPEDPDNYWISPNRWVNDVKAGLRFKKHPKVITIKYEKLVLSFSDVMVRICDFIGEEFIQELNEWHKYTDIKKNKAWQGSVKQLYTDSLAKYKTTKDKSRLKEIMRNEEVVELLKKLNYHI